MIVYEVNLTIDKAIKNDFSDWLKPHIQEILEISGFLRANLSEVDEATKKDSLHWCVQYFVKDRKSLDDYFQFHASKLRQDGLNRFGGKFSATRRVMTLLEGFN